MNDLYVGEKYLATIVMSNDGSDVWKNDASKIYRLYSQEPGLNNIWGVSSVELPYSVSGGNSVAFSFTITAPNTPGDYPFNWQMHKSLAAGGDNFFGSKCSPTFTVKAKNSAAVEVSYPSGSPDGQTHILRELIIENIDMGDGSKGGHPVFHADKSFGTYIEKAVWWEINDLNSNQLDAPRKILVTLIDEAGSARTLEMTVTLKRPITLPKQ